MKKTLIIILPAALLIIALTGYFTLNNSRQLASYEKVTSAVDSSKINSAVKKSGEKKSCCSEDKEEEAVGEFTDNSVYQLGSSWSNELNNKILLGDLKGHNVVLAMIFASCTYACPLIVNDMRKVEAQMPENEKTNVKFVLVSIDPERDSPKALFDYSRKQNLDLSRWELLTGNKNDVRSLAALLGFKYKKNDNGDYVHSNLISVLNKEGEVVLQHEGLNKDVQDIVSRLKAIN
ncbi:MAG: SCO family protein [Bacteroidota bacterium]|nr:SCO family protein [Ignavibacteria bacterium]MCU7521398.1 SCO family protein [Ignavibacteria bacterium]MCU7524155.1 SCO family protein [Ignavibacteria bacterium]